MIPPQGSKTKQGYELQLGTNNVAPFLFTKLLTPLLIKTAANATPGTVRVTWVSSSAAKRFSPPGGIDMSNLDYKKEQSAWQKYGASKAGNILHSSEFARRFKDSGVISLVSIFCALKVPFSLTKMCSVVFGSRKFEDRSLQTHAWLAKACGEYGAQRPDLWGIYGAFRWAVTRCHPSEERSFR